MNNHIKMQVGVTVMASVASISKLGVHNCRDDTITHTFSHAPGQ